MREGKTGNRLKWLIVSITVIVTLTASGLLLAASQPVRADSPGKALLDASQGLDDITIHAVYHPDSRTLDAVQTICITNTFTQSVTELVLRTYANAFMREDTSPAAIEEIYDQCYPNGFSSGGMSVSRIMVNGREVPAVYRDTAGTVLAIPLDTPLGAGETVTVDLAYQLTLPECRYRFGYADGVAVFGNAFPVPAVFEDGAFREEAYYPIGDPFISDCANYHVSVTVPEGYRAVGSGCSVRDGQTFTFDSIAVREFALVISDAYVEQTGKAGGVAVFSYARTSAQARKALNVTLRALEVFTERIGALPYPSLTIAQTSFAFTGMEYPQLFLLGSDGYDGHDSTLEWTAAHETAHQWFYAAVGSDQYYAPWQDEALCEYLVYDYIGARYGQSARQDAINRRAGAAMRVTVPRGVTAGSPISYFSDFAEYSLVVYHRGAALLVALEEAYGRETLMDALRVYYDRYSFKRATRQDFEDTLAEATGRNMKELIVDYLDTYIIH